MNILKKILPIFNRSQNIFVAFLKLSNVKCTNWYSNQYYNDHPDKYSFYGISRMLSEYNVENVGVRVKDKKQSLDKLDVPFITNVGSEFVIVNKKDEEVVNYLWHDKEISVTSDKFLDIWSGAVLIAEANDNSVEPNYDYNRKYELFVIFERSAIFLIFLILLFYFWFIYENALARSLLLLINLIGVVASGLLLSKQLKVQGKFIDNICSLLLPHSDCNSMLEGKASKLFNLISWGEIGFGYFVSNVFILLFVPDLFFVIPILNIFTLPYTLWSVWYQKIVAKQWCVLCLMVQFLLWGIFLVSLFGRHIQPLNDWWKILIVGVVYLFFVLSINMVIRFIFKYVQNKNMSYELKSLKSNETVFLSLLKNEIFVSDYKSCSSILFGNVNAPNVITVVTNPHCNPCAMLHSKLKTILEKKDFCIQYVFTSFGKEFDDSCLFLISIYLNYELSIFEGILSEWFEYGKLDRESFFDKYSITVKNDQAYEEYELHKEMLKETNLVSTPTLFFDGYRLPESYGVEDLTCFYHLKL